jgi:glycine/D-amino acid oxidase-like deaminating enzyme
MQRYVACTWQLLCIRDCSVYVIVARAIVGSDAHLRTLVLRAKVIAHDPRAAIAEDSPMVIAASAITLPWSNEERELLSEADPHTACSYIASRWLEAALPSGAHFRPAGNGWRLMLWDWAHERAHVPLVLADEGAVVDDEQFDALYPELMVRAVSTIVPAFSEYIAHVGRNTRVDGGYYTKTPDQLPAIGGLSDVRGMYICAGFAGFGVMACHGAAALLANSIQSHAQHNACASFDVLHKHARAFDPNRFGGDCSGGSGGVAATKRREVGIGGQL